MGLTFDRFLWFTGRIQGMKLFLWTSWKVRLRMVSVSPNTDQKCKKRMIFTSFKTKFGRNIVIYDTLIYFIYHIHDSFGEWQASCCEHRILRPEISTCTASSRVGSRTKAGQTRQTRQMFLVEEFLTKSNIYQICTWLELLFFLFLS